MKRSAVPGLSRPGDGDAKGGRGRVDQKAPRLRCPARPSESVAATLQLWRPSAIAAGRVAGGGRRRDARTVDIDAVGRAAPRARRSRQLQQRPRLADPELLSRARAARRAARRSAERRRPTARRGRRRPRHRGRRLPRGPPTGRPPRARRSRGRAARRRRPPFENSCASSAPACGEKRRRAGPVGRHACDRRRRDRRAPRRPRRRSTRTAAPGPERRRPSARPRAPVAREQARSFPPTARLGADRRARRSRVSRRASGGRSSSPSSFIDDQPRRGAEGLAERDPGVARVELDADLRAVGGAAGDAAESRDRRIVEDRARPGAPRRGAPSRGSCRPTA